jgi:hypothetical protein
VLKRPTILVEVNPYLGLHRSAVSDISHRTGRGLSISESKPQTSPTFQTKSFLQPSRHVSTTTTPRKKNSSMTLYAIIGPVHSDKLPITMSPTTSTGPQPTSERGSVIVIRRSSSDVSIAGSMDSFDSDLTVGSPRISSPPPSNKYGQTMPSILLQARLITYHSSLKF